MSCRSLLHRRILRCRALSASSRRTRISYLTRTTRTSTDVRSTPRLTTSNALPRRNFLIAIRMDQMKRTTRSRRNRGSTVWVALGSLSRQRPRRPPQMSTEHLWRLCHEFRGTTRGIVDRCRATRDRKWRNRGLVLAFSCPLLLSKTCRFLRMNSLYSRIFLINQKTRRWRLIWTQLLPKTSAPSCFNLLHKFVKPWNSRVRQTLHLIPPRSNFRQCRKYCRNRPKKMKLEFKWRTMGSGSWSEQGF